MDRHLEMHFFITYNMSVLNIRLTDRQFISRKDTKGNKSVRTAKMLHLCTVTPCQPGLYHNSEIVQITQVNE